VNTFSTGDKCVCIDDRFDPRLASLYTQFPKKDSVYVIREVRLGIRPDCKTGDVSLLLVGIVNPSANSRSGLERGFSADRFRPLDEMKSRNKTVEVVDLIEPAELMECNPGAIQ